MINHQQNILNKEKLAIIEESIKIPFPKDDKWEVYVLVPFEEAYEDSLPTILKLIKSKISRKYNLPIGLLNYDSIKQKEIESGGIRLTAVVSQSDPEKGDPVLRFLSAKSSQGVEYDDMSLYIDIYPMMENGHKVTLKDIDNLLFKAMVPIDRINIDIIEHAMKLIEADMVPVRNLKLAEGKLPEPSVDAQVKFLFTFNEVGEDKYTSSVVVKANQLLCTKAPAIEALDLGYTVRGTEVKPAKPRDIVFIGRTNVNISSGGDKVYSKVPGIVAIKESAAVDDPNLSTIEIDVEPVDVFDGDEPLEIKTDQHVHIVRGLKSGSTIHSRGEVVIDGDVQDNASVFASGDINISGKVNNARLVSDSNVECSGSVQSTKINAKKEVLIRGLAEDSQISGYEVRIDMIKSCKINAGLMLVVDTITKDETGFAGSLTVGLTKYLDELIQVNNEIIESLKLNLDRAEEIVGKEIIEIAEAHNVVRLLVLFMRSMREKGVEALSNEQRESIKRLISIIGPMRNILREKNELNESLRKEIKNRREQKSKFVIKNRVEIPVEVEIDNIKATIIPDDRAIIMQRKGAKIIKKTLDALKDVFPDISD